MKSSISRPPSSASRRSISTLTVDWFWCAIHRESFRDNPENFDLRKPGIEFMAAYAEYIIHKNTMLGSAGQLESVREMLKK